MYLHITALFLYYVYVLMGVLKRCFSAFFGCFLHLWGCFECCFFRFLSPHLSLHLSLHSTFDIKMTSNKGIMIPQYQIHLNNTAGALKEPFLGIFWDFRSAGQMKFKGPLKAFKL